MNLDRPLKIYCAIIYQIHLKFFILWDGRNTCCYIWGTTAWWQTGNGRAGRNMPGGSGSQDGHKTSTTACKSGLSYRSEGLPISCSKLSYQEPRKLNNFYEKNKNCVGIFLNLVDICRVDIYVLL